MDWYPLLNSLRIAAISAVVVFFAGIAAAYYIAKLPRLLKGILDVGADAAAGPAAHGGRLSAAARAGAEAAHRRVGARDVRHPGSS